MKDPEKNRRRVLFISGLNAWSIIVVAGLFALISMLLVDVWGTVVGIAVLVSPWMELKGRKRLMLQQGQARRWLTRSQLWLFAVITIYCISQLLIFHFSPALQDMPSDLQESLRTLLALDARELQALLSQIYYVVYLSVIMVSFLYQGGLYWYYRRHVAES